MFFINQPHFEEEASHGQEENSNHSPPNKIPIASDLSSLRITRGAGFNPTDQEIYIAPNTSTERRPLIVLGVNEDLRQEAEALATAIPVYLPDSTIHFDAGRFSVSVRCGWKPERRHREAIEAALQMVTDFDVEVDWNNSIPSQGEPEREEDYQANNTRKDAAKETLTPVTGIPESIKPDPSRQLEASSGKGIDTGRINQAIISTLPEQLELVRTTFFHSPLEEGTLSFVVLKVHMDQGLTPEIAAWRENLEITYRLGIILQPASDARELEESLQAVADEDGLIRDRTAVADLMKVIHGMPLPVTPDAGGPAVEPVNFTDLTEEYAIAVDPPGAKDIDDILMAKRLDDGSIELQISFVDAAWRVRPGSELDRYIRKAGSSLYGEASVVPMLGGALSFNEISLREGKERFAFTVKIIVDPEGKITDSDIFRSRVKNHCQLSFGKADRILKGKNHEAGDLLRVLQDAAGRLRANRMQKGTALMLQGETGSDQIIEEAMIHAKHCIAGFCEKNKIPILYKVHTPPAYMVRRQLAKEVRKAGLKVSAKHDFTDPLAFREMITTLRDMQQYRLLFKILDVYMQRANYSTQKNRHHGLDIDTYTEIKARHEAGLINQRQLAQFLDGDSGYTAGELKRREHGVNTRVRSYFDKLHRYITFERIFTGLSRQNQTVDARVKKIGPDETMIRVKGISARCILSPDSKLPLRRGQELKVTMEGYNVEERAFVFSIKDPDLTKGGRKKDQSI